MAKAMVVVALLLSSLAWLDAAHGSGASCAATRHGSDLTIMHPYGPCSPFPEAKAVSWEDAMLKMAAKDEGRLLYLASLQVAPKGRKRTFVPIASGRQMLQSPAYIVKASLGTPPQPMLMAMDISNDVAWIPCSGCLGCSSTVFSSTTSSSYKTLGCQDPQCKQVPNPTCAATCSFNQTYGISTFRANLSQDTITLAGDSVPFYTFGCLQAVTGGSVPPQGLLGLGRGPMSLLSQTQNLYHSTFSYCLPSFKSLSFTGTLRLGPSGQPIRIKTTPLLRNPRRPSLYYVNMISIRVARRVVDIPPSALAFNPVTGAGTIIDSGTAVTRLVEPAYFAVRDEFRRRVNKTVTSLGGFDTCYNGAIVAPTITFQFPGMNMTLGEENVLIHSTAGSISCLAMASAPANVNSVLNVIASMQQQNHRILFDGPNNRVGISRELCT